MSRRLYLLLPLLFLLNKATFAQRGLDGTWEGKMLIGGIYSAESLPMQLYLTSRGATVEGRSYVQLPNGSTLRMDLAGRHYADGSVRLLETAFAGDSLNEQLPPFKRKYQIIFKDDLWDPALQGFWQEIREDIFAPGRRRGRMVLTRKKGKGA